MREWLTVFAKRLTGTVTYLEINVTRRDGTFGYVTRSHASHVVTYEDAHRCCKSCFQQSTSSKMLSWTLISSATKVGFSPPALRLAGSGRSGKQTLGCFANDTSALWSPSITSPSYFNSGPILWLMISRSTEYAIMKSSLVSLWGLWKRVHWSIMKENPKSESVE